MSERSCANPTRCHEVASIVTTVLRALMNERAVNGAVSLSDIDKMLALVERGTISLDEAFRRLEERCRKDMSRPKGNVGARSNPFQRLVVRPFEHHLMGENAFPRPYLAHYFEFVDHVIANRKDEFERHSRSIIQALLVVHGNNLTWDHFYSDARTLKTLHAALKIITHALTTPEGNKAWGHFMHRPAGDLPVPSVPDLTRLRDALLETHRGLSAAG